MQLKLFVAIIFLGLAAALKEEEFQREWLNFQHKFGKTYRNRVDNLQKYNNFKKNYQLIQEHNKRYGLGLESYTMAVNPYTDLNLKEMEEFNMGLKMSERDQEIFNNLEEFQPSVTRAENYPASKDWRNEGGVSPVKNQGGCGSCWAFSSSGALESHHLIKHKKNISISEQNLVDCVSSNYGCQGGWMIPCFEYVRKNKGINSESDYPYEAADGKCRYNSKKIAATCTGYRKITKNSESQLLKAVASIGPISVAIDANENFSYFQKGIYDDASCSKTPNHAVLVVGYGSENGKDYWLVKNSWGTYWGDGGYIKMARNKNNQCGIAQYASYPLV